jgi:D-alanine--D-alanine ligase
MAPLLETPFLNIALIAEQRSTYHDQGYSEEECAALPHNGEADNILTTLQDLGHHVTLVPGIQALVKYLAAGTYKDWDLAFNIAQGFHGLAREAQVPALLDAYQVPYTFSNAATMALCQNKVSTKIILAHHKIPTAPFAVISCGEHKLNLGDLSHMLPRYPLFLKPVTEGSSKGIGRFNKVTEPADLESAVKKLRSLLPDQDILVEPFLSGRELSVSILGTGAQSRVIGVTEHVFEKPSSNSAVENRNCHSLEFASRKSKCSDAGMLVVRSDPGLMAETPVKAACQVALDAWKTLGCRDAGRVDIRFSSYELDAVPNVLELNPIAGLLPGHSPLALCSEENGIPYKDLLAAITQSALARKTVCDN